MSINNFITRVQNSNEATKRFWVVAFSGTSMLLVLALWLGYLNVAIAPIPGPANKGLANSQQPIVKNGELEKPGFFSIFAAGVKIIFDGAKEKFLTRKDIIIKSPTTEQNFIAENLEPVKPTVLP